MTSPFSPEHAPTSEVPEIDTAEHMKHAAAAIHLYEVFGLMNEDSVKFVAELLRPPHELQRPADLAYPGARDYYSRFMAIADAEKPGARPFEAARHIYAITMPVSRVLDEMLEGVPTSELNPEFVEYASAVLPQFADHISSGRLVI